MTLSSANKNIRDFYGKSSPTEEEEFLFIESIEYVIKETNDPGAMMQLGGLYYEKQHFDLALKYYEMAALKEYVEAYECLGYIWYYGRTGTKDYKKAFEYFTKAKEKGNIVAAYKVADMYKNGYGVDKDYEKYKSIIKDLYDNLGQPRNYFEPYPEIYTRLAKIYIEENKNDEARKLLMFAKDFLATRITYNAFFGNFTIMKFLIYDLYKVQDIDYNDFDFYDLYEILKTPHVISFYYNGAECVIESILEDGNLVVKYNDKWFRTIDDFISKATIGDELLAKLHFDLYSFTLVK